MTPMPSARPQMTVEEFEVIERSAPETVRLEFINGKIEVKPVPDGNHDEVIAWLQQLCMQSRPDLWLYPERGLKISAYWRGRARTDGALAPRRHFTGAGEWAEPDGVLMVVEVTSHAATPTGATVSRSRTATRRQASRSTSSSTGRPTVSPSTPSRRRAVTAPPPHAPSVRSSNFLTRSASRWRPTS